MAMKRCRVCKHRISRDAKACPECGDDPEVKKKRQSRWFGLAIALCGVILIYHFFLQGGLQLPGQ
jgi:RNA polymerase subunit RPABC4/transcription elongation factor Spt4